MSRYFSLIRLVLIAVIVIVLGGVLGWYYFLRGAEQQTTVQGTEAGYDAPAPIFAGSTGSTYANVVSTLGEDPGVSATSSTSRLWEVSEVPVAGFGWQKNSAGALYFVERSSGYVFEAATAQRSVLRLTDTLRPKVYEASVTLDGSVLERSIDDTGTLITFAGSVATSTPSSQAADQPSATSSLGDLVGNDLPGGIGEVAADPAYDMLYYTIPSPSGVSLVSTNFAGVKEKQLFTSAISGWHLIAPGDDTLVLLQAPLDNAEGYAYQLQKSGSLALIAQAPGLTVLPHASSTALIFGSSQNGKLPLFVRSSAGASATQLSIQTIADKCAWTPGKSLIAYCAAPQNIPSQQFLDDWYKGIVHTSDKFYEIDASSASTTLLYDPSGDTNAQLDVEDISVDPSGQYIAFINAKDQSLWVLRISQ